MFHYYEGLPASCKWRYPPSWGINWPLDTESCTAARWLATTPQSSLWDQLTTQHRIAHARKMAGYNRRSSPWEIWTCLLLPEVVLNCPPITRSMSTSSSSLFFDSSGTISLHLATNVNNPKKCLLKLTTVVILQAVYQQTSHLLIACSIYEILASTSHRTVHLFITSPSKSSHTHFLPVPPF